MIFWLCVLIMVVGIILWTIGCKEYIDGMWMAGSMLAIFFGLAVLIMSIVLCANYSTADANVAEREELYRAITYKVESESCRDEFGLLSKEIIDEVQEWNKGIIYRQNIQRNFWVGIFYPNTYDKFKTIDYEKYNYR